MSALLKEVFGVLANFERRDRRRHCDSLVLVLSLSLLLLLL
jgi:hypothetical protein